MSKKPKMELVQLNEAGQAQTPQVEIIKKPKSKKVDQALAMSRLKHEIETIEPEYSRWEDLEGIYVECAKGVIDIAKSVNHTYESFKEHPEIPIPHGAATAINGISRDLSHLTDELVKIHKDHRDLQGPIRTDEAFSRSVSITQDYIGFQERFKTAILPPLSVISEALIKRADLIKKQEEDQQTETAPKDLK
jgi:hypothetical protein